METMNWLSYSMEQTLIEVGAKSVKPYFLVNNAGYTFEKNGLKFDLRHFTNIYGAEVNYWGISAKKDGEQFVIKEYSKDFNTFEEAIDFIKGV